MFDVDFLVKARLELFEARLWYEEQQPGLGKRFKEDVLDKIALILNNPLHYPSKRNGHREANTDVFPFIIVYKIASKQSKIFIVSVFHTSRHPKGKYKPPREDIQP
jgi:plasmid stabilization system protein ParE